MATEEEAREAAADGEEVQVEAVDLGTPHLQMNLDSKLSAHGMKDEAKIMDSTEGTLKVTEDQVLEKTPSVVEIPPEHTPNGTASSLNGHMKEGEISNEKPQENGQKANEQAEASPDGIRTDQNNRSNGEEAVDSLGHVESSTEDTSLLTDENEEPKEHYQQDVESATVEEETVHEDTVETDQPTVDAQQGQNLEPAEVTEDTQHTSTSCIPHDEVVAEATAGVQTSLEPNVDDSGALPDASDGNTETEPAKVDKESCTEDADTAEHANEIIKLEDQPSKQTDDVDAELVKEDVPTSKKTDVPEAMTKAEQADESMSPSDQEELNQESAEETIDPVCERTEETSHGSNVSASEKTTPEHDATAREPDLDVQEVQSQGLAEEIADAKEVDSEKTVQQSGVAFEEATQDHNVATIEPSSDIQHLDNVESEIKGLEDAKAEDASNESNVIIPEDAAQDKEATEDIQPAQGLEEEPKSTGTVEVEEASNQPHADVLNNHAEVDGVPACPHQVKDTGVTETQEITQQSHAAASEELVTEDKSMAVDSRNDDIQQTLEQGSVKVKGTEASETQEICHERTISASEEDSAEDDVTAEGPTSDAQEVEIVESVEEIKDNTADNIVEASNVATVEEADQEHNVLTSDDVSEQQTREVEPEEIQTTEHVETEEASDERHPALLKDPTQEDSIPSDMLKTESTEEAKETEATKTEVLPQESNISTSEEPASEENITASEITCDAQEVENSEQAEDVEDNKDTGTKDISGHSNENNLEEMATEDNITIQTDASIQQLQEQEPVELRDTEATELQGISPSHIVSTSRESTPEDNVTAELSPDSQAENLESATVTEETKDVSSTDAVAEEETPEERIQEFEAPVHTPSAEEPVLEETKNTDNQMDAAVLENTTHEDNPTASDLLVMESAEVSISEATEGQEMPQSEVTQSEDHETEENTTASEPKVLEPEAAEEMRDTEPTGPQSISQESIVSISEESVPEDVTAKGPASDTKEVQTEEPELIDEHNDVKAGEISNQSSGSIVGETAQENLESSTVTEESRDVISTEAIAEETPEEHVQEFEATVDIPPVEEPEQEETKNTEPVEVHDNVAINGQPAEEVKNTEATEIAEIHNESGDLNEDVKSNVSLADKAAPDEYAEATEALEETKNSEPVEVENNTIARDLPEEEIKDTEAMEIEVIPDESTGAKITEFTNDALADEEAPEELVIETEATSDIPRAQEPELEEIKNAEPAEVEGNISATEQSAEEIEATDTTEAEAINESINVNTSKLTEDVTAKEAASDIKEVQTEEPELVDEHNDVKAGEISNHSSVSIVGETAQANLESATVSEETKEVKSTDTIAEEETPEKHVQEFVAPVDIPAVEEPELEETKNTEPVSVHDNVMTNDLPAEEVKDTQATETTEIHNESGHLTEDVKSNVVLSDEASPDEDAEATEATADIPRAQDSEQEQIKNNEPVEVEDNIIARDLPEEEIKATEAMETEVIPDESTSAKITELTNDALAEAAPEELVIETEATIDIPRAKGPELEEIKNAEPAELEENISATDRSAEEIEATDTTEAEAINESINANTSELTEDVTAKEAASNIKEVQTEEPELIDEHNDVKDGEISNQSSRTIVGVTAQENLESAAVTEETEDVKSTDAIAEEETPVEHVQEFEAPVDTAPVEEPELEEAKNTEHVSVHDNVMTNDLPAEEVKDTQATEIAEIHNESGNLTEDVNSNVVLLDEAAPGEDVEATEATADIPQAQEPEQEQIKNNESVEVEDDIIARDLPEEEIKDTEAMETEADESTSAKVTELTNDVKSNVARAEETAPEEHGIETEATIDIPRAQEPELEEIKNAEPAELEENISATDRSAEEIEASDTTEAEAINGSINANTSELTEDVRAKEAASDIKEVQTEEPELIDEHTDVKDGEISNQSSRTIVGVTAQENLESAAVTEETEDVKITDAIAEEETPVEHVQEFEAPVDTAPVEEPELEEAKNTEHVSVHDNVMTNDLPAEEVKDTQATEIAEIHNESGNLTEDVNSNVVLLDEAAPGEDVEATEATADIPQAQDPEQEQIKNNESVEVEADIIARDLPEEEIKDTEAMETEAIPDESTSAKVTELTNDVKSNVARAEETAPEEHGIETEATIDIPRAQEPELEETKNTEPLEVDEDMSATDQSAEETKATEAMETEAINESIDANSSKLTEDVKRNSLEYEAAYEEHAIAAETTVNIPRAQEPELEEIKNTEPVEVKENIPASDLPAEEVKETEVIGESTDANISEPTEDVKRNVALADEADSEDHVIAPEATVDVPRAQEPELEEIENAEHVEVEENISANDLPAEENFTENEPQTTGIEPTRPEPTPHESNITIQQLQEQEPDEFCDTEATEPQGISPPHIASTSEEFTPEDNVATEPSPDTQAEDSESAVVTEKTKDVKSIDGIPEEETPEEHVQELETPVDIPPVEEPELEETKNTEPVEVHDNVATNDLPAEEVKNTEATEIAEIHNESGDPTEDVKSNVAFADDAAPDEDAKATEETADIPQAQEPELEEIKNSEPVEVKENISGSDLPAEEVEETEVISETTDANITEDANRNVAVADEAAPEEHVIATEATVDIPRAQEPEIEENENAEHVEVEENISANDLPAEEVKDTVIMETQAIKESTDANISGLTEDVALADEAVPDVHVDISSAQEPAVEEINNTKPVEVEDSITADDVPAEEINDTEAMETEEIPHENTDDSLTASAPLADMQQAPEESSEQGSDPDLLVQSEDSKDQLVKAEKTGQSNGATLEEPTAEDNAPNETDPLADAKEDHGVESVEGNKGIEADEGEETSHPSQDAEEPVSESIVATIEPTSDIQQVNDLDEAKEMTVTEAIDDEETSCKKTEVATLEGLSPTDNGTSPKQKDESSVLGEKTALTTQKGESPAEEDVQISGEDTVGISNNIEQIKEQSKAVTEADTIKSDEHTSDQGDEQLQNVELQMQVCERSVDVSAIEQPDKDAKKIHLDQQQKEDEAIEEQTEEIQGNEQKHDESSTDLTTETQLEPQSNEIGTTDMNQDTDEFEAEQTETVATEMLMNEQTLHVPQGSIPSTADVKVENSTEIEETPEQEKAPNNIGTLYTDADAENYNEDEKEKIEIDAAVAKPSTDELDGTPDEAINEEVGNGLASPVKKDLQKTSDPAPSNEETLENDTTVVPENVEPRVHREETESINKANDDMEASQASEEEIVDDVEKKQERKNEDTDVNNDGVQTKSVGEEASELHSNDSTDTKMDDTMSPYAEMVHGRIDAQPTETEEVEDNNGFSSISEYVVEYPKQNDVEQDLIVHPKVVDDKLATAEQNGAEVETNSDEETATSYTAVTEAVKFDEAIDNKASGADGALSDENVETFEENRSNLEASSVVTASGESKNEDREQHNLALPAYSAVDGNTTEQASGSEVTERGLLFPEKPLPNESEEHEESQTTKEQDEDIHGQETGDTEKEDKEDEQSDLPVSNFLMNLIMGKESTQPDGNLEFEAEKKQEEITKDDGCLITSQHEESLVPVHTENKVDNKLIFEQGKDNLEGSEEIHDFKMESDEVLSRNTHNLEAPVCEKNVQGEVSSELVPGGHGLMTEVETRDIKLGEKTTNSEERRLKNDLDDSTNPKVSQENTLEEGRTDLQRESLPEDISSDAVAEQTHAVAEQTHAVAEQTLLSTEPDISDEKKLPKDNDDLQSPLSTKGEEFTESSITEAENAIEAVLENEVEKEEEKQHTTNTGGATEGKIENLHGNSQKGTETISDEQMAEITEPVMGTEINLVHEKEIFTGSECEEETQSSEKALDIQPDGSSLHVNQDKQDESAGDQIVMEKNNLLDKPGESNLHEEQEAEIGQEPTKESDGGQNCLATTEPVIKEENANRTVEAHVQTVNTKSIEEQEIFMSQVQERGLDVVSAKEAPEAEENIVDMAKPKFSTDEEQSSKEDKSVMAGEKTCVEKTKDEEEAKSFSDEVATKIEEQGAVQKATHNQTRDLNVVLPSEAPGSEESFVDIKTPEFSTDEEQSPKEDESSMAEDNSYDEKTKGDQEAKNFTDEAPMKIEERGTGQKASPKKHNILSGVGSKVKHQLAKVKKAIIGKPGHAKSELAKS
uniref:Uncharacterized protein n=1 Tax=Avena sativa TaxID=4498 RepID=A0ACD5TC75_AVESA